MVDVKLVVTHFYSSFGLSGEDSYPHFRQEAVIVIGILKRMVKEKVMECTVRRGFSRHQRILETQKMQDVYVIQVSKNTTLTVR